jgi:hypothetical protein
MLWVALLRQDESKVSTNELLWAYTFPYSHPLDRIFGYLPFLARFRAAVLLSRHAPLLAPVRTMTSTAGPLEARPVFRRIVLRPCPTIFRTDAAASFAFRSPLGTRPDPSCSHQ